MKGSYFKANVDLNRAPNLRRNTNSYGCMYIIRAKSCDEAKRMLQEKIKFGSILIQEYDIDKRIDFFHKEMKKLDIHDSMYECMKTGYINLLDIKKIISNMKYREIYKLKKDDDGIYHRVELTSAIDKMK